MPSAASRCSGCFNVSRCSDMRRPRPSPRSQTASRLACVAGLAGLLLTSEGRACGYHDNVSIARGVLNWVYPDALHVIGAISSAVAQKQLSHRDPESVGPGFFGSQYHATAKALERFAELLGGGSDDAPELSFSLVLVEPVLWTHFEIGPRGPRAQVHVSGPAEGPPRSGFRPGRDPRDRQRRTWNWRGGQARPDPSLWNRAANRSISAMSLGTLGLSLAPCTIKPSHAMKREE